MTGVSDAKMFEPCLQTDCKTERTFNLEEPQCNIYEALDSSRDARRTNLSLKKLTYSPVRAQEAFSQYPRSNAQNYNEIKNLKRQTSLSQRRGLPPTSSRALSSNTSEIFKTERDGSVGKSPLRLDQNPKNKQQQEKNYIRNMLKNSILSSNDDKIDFLVSEIESANTKISMLEGYIRGGIRAEESVEEKKE